MSRDHETRWRLRSVRRVLSKAYMGMSGPVPEHEVLVAEWIGSNGEQKITDWVL